MVVRGLDGVVVRVMVRACMATILWGETYGNVFGQRSEPNRPRLSISAHRFDFSWPKRKRGRSSFQKELRPLFTPYHGHPSD
jgi:hypothetical protein